MRREQTQRHPRVTGTMLALPAGAAAWRAVAPPAVPGPHLLSGVAAVSATEAWAVGNAGQAPLAARWDGASWTVPPGAPVNPGLAGASLQDVAVLAAGRAVAVGGGHDRLAGAEVPLLHEWDGAAWTAWDGGGPGRVLTGVATAGDEVWAVGHGFPWGGAEGPLVLHRADGGWRPVPVPAVPRGRLLAVSGTAPDDVWAVGAADRAALVLHYDGRAWRRTPVPALRAPLADVAAVSRTEAWAVGRDQVLRWNGRRWTRVKAPVTGANTVTAASGTVWVAGGGGELARFDGRAWTRDASAAPPFGAAAVWLASASDPGGVWLAGTRQVADPEAPGGAPSVPARTADG
ncbi:WD40/YVTN/BNR-like repeat-containing protein [Actinomadura parmotrematis]|uniref:Galactose oxidase n=1 Tax=Actinomadura parmotrematis TaxID=2864039 RepID=A0ABS7G5U3_9ACTN|nr:hypothetical protein [Actinomadura parmotrematis]MBW8487013.1 hypothetical protein [Actinomadura parmotrematis]